MSDALYNSLRSLSSSIITQFGRDIVFVTKTSSYDPTTGQLTTSETTSTVKSIRLELDFREQNDERLKDTSFKEIAVLSSEPELEDILRIDGRDYVIKQYNKLKPGNVDILYELFVA